VCDGFTNLHNHSVYSLLDGNIGIKQLVQRVKELNQTSVAITDHGVLHGYYEFYKEAKKEGIKPILGSEAYLAPKSRFDRDKNDNKPFHLLLLAKNNKGFANLSKIISDASLNGFYHKPRTDKNFLADHSEGIIASSGCLASELPSMIMSGVTDSKLEKALFWWLDIFGEDFYLELQPRENSYEQKLVNNKMIELSKRHGVPLIATTDAHYLRQTDAELHDIALCMQTGAKLSDEKRMRFLPESSFYIMARKEIERYFRDIPSALDNTMKIAEKCEVSFEKGKYHLPNFTLPQKYNTPNEMLRELVYASYPKKYDVDPHIEKRIEYELEVINGMGFDTYFLIVWDVCQFMEFEDIWWNVRGSGAGSIIAYLLGITSVCPLKNGLYFERFLNPDRISMPDIDIDVQDREREKVVEYIVARYGKDNVSAIITYGTLGIKGAIRDVGRVQGVPLNIVNEVSALIPNSASYEDAILIDGVKEKIKSNKAVEVLFNVASNLIGMPRHTSHHPAGYIITAEPVSNYVPTMRLGKDASVVEQKTQLPMEEVEELGLLKLDILGLSTLTVMHDTRDLIFQRHGQNWNINDIPYDASLVNDPEHIEMLEYAFKLIASGNTIGVFQIEGSGLTDMLKHMQPYEFAHIVAAIALYRPGPMDANAHMTYIKRMHGDEPVDYVHEKLESILGDTFGLLVYQEQIIKIATEMFDYSPGEADSIRKYVSKQKVDELKQHKEKFKNNGRNNGIDESTIDQIWDTILYFGGYGFNLSHATDYAKITMQTAFLKANYTIEYITALLNANIGNTEKIVKIIKEAKSLGIIVEKPSINNSEVSFTIVNDNTIQMGFTSIKGIGESSLNKFFDLRQVEACRTLEKFVDEGLVDTLNKTALENMTKCGVFDIWGYRREDLLESWIHLKKNKKKKNKDQMVLFETPVNTVELTQADYTFTERELLDFELEYLGFYVTERPIDKYHGEFNDKHLSNIEVLLSGDLNQQHVEIGGEIKSVRLHIDKNDNTMAFITVEDYSENASTMQVTVFASTYSKYDFIAVGKFVVVSGKIDNNWGGVKMLANSFEYIGE
jgi:DNA polymerase III subunit alpha